MKNNKRMLFALSFLLITMAWNNLSAQCTNCTSDGPLNTLSYARPAYAPDWTTVQSNSVEGRDYMLFNVIKGQIYRWTTYGSEDQSLGLDQPCTDDGDCVTGLVCEGLTGSKTCELGFDTQLTLIKGTCSESGEILAYNRKALFRNQSMIEWKADFDGTVFLLVNNYDCTTSCDIDGLNCMTTTVKWQRKDSSHCSDCSYSYPTTMDPPETPAAPFSMPVDAPGWTLTANNDIKAGEFQTFAVDKGKIYRWSTCSDDTFDTQLTLYRGTATPGECGLFLEYSDDSPDTGNCLSGSKQTVLEWKSDFNGYVTVLLNQYNCATCGKSQNPSDPYGHCSVSSLEWQRFDCNECLSDKGTHSIDDSLKSFNNADSGNYYKFALEKGGQYVFRSVKADSGVDFTGILTLRKDVGSACYGETLKQSEQVYGSHIQQLVFTPLADMNVELLISGDDCSSPAGKKADITYQMIYDPDERFDEYEDENGDTWTGTVFDGETQTVFLDDNVTKENWADAIQYCEDLVYTIPGSGGTTVEGWSLPNINQLYSVVDFNLFDPATSADWVSYITDTSGEGGACTQPTQETDCTYPKYICGEEKFSGGVGNQCMRNNWYWSATSVYGTEEFAWGVNMKDGRSYRALKYDYDGTNSTAYRVICVTGVSVFGELDALRPAEERIFSGWACDKQHSNDAINIFFEIFYSVDPVNNPGNIKSVLKTMNFVAYGGEILKVGRYGWKYDGPGGDTDLFPAPGSLKEFKINSNCNNTAQTTPHAYELDFNDTTNNLVQKMRAAIASDSDYKPPYYVTAWAKEYGNSWAPKNELPPEREIFVLNDVCGDNHVTGTEQCDDGNTVTEDCAYNTSCIVCDSSCNLSAGYSPHCGDTNIDAPDENCDCGPGFWEMNTGTCKTSLASKRCPGYDPTGTNSCTICNEICQEEILSVPTCGDGFTDPVEACDDGDVSNNNACLTNCQLNVCGDGYIFNSGPGADETCDDGSKNGYYENQCVPGPCCNTTCDGDGPHCGDSIVQRVDCTGYSPCTGGITGANEICDKGTDNGKWLTLAEHNLDAGCSSTCDDIAPYCGDGTLQSAYEICDDGGANQDGVYGKCQTDCQAKPRCGDGRIDGPGGDGLTTGPETCDDGVNNGAYGYCNNSCTGYVECGDAVLQSTHEECDLGTGNFSDYSVDKDYSCCIVGVGDCIGNCVVGRYCGDAFIDDGRDSSVATDLYYRFDEVSGALVSDYSGNGRDGVVSNVLRVYGKYQRGIFIDDSNTPSLERATGPGIVATTDLTLEAWVFPMEYAADYATVILGNPAYYLSVYKDGSLRAYWYDKVPAGYHSTAAGLVPLKKWTHIAAVWSATDLKLYINGSLKNTIPVTGTGRAATSTIIGAQTTARQFIGIIDEVAISARAFTVDELMIHANGKSGAEYCDDGDVDHGNGNVPVGTAILDYETTCSDECKYFHFCGDGKVDGPGGDGLTSGPEVCDDGLPGNFGEYNRCNPGCMELGPHCGDGEKNGPEDCDKFPGNSDASGTVWDGSNDAAATCRTDCTWARCGDGIQDTGEECDDGALNSDTDPGACRMNCTVSRCGDSVRDPGEQCDDGNMVDFDSCTAVCLNARCGDGITKTIDSTTGQYSWAPNETCDDGNVNNNDYCASDCMSVTGYCGDGSIQTGHPASEACDNATTGDGIGAYCTGNCTGSGASMTCDVGCSINHGACGDGDIDYIAGEICDDGNSINGDYCSHPNCQITGYCGDGTVQVNEICDSADPAVGAGQGIGGYCINNCQTNLGSCGDGKIQGPGYTAAMYGGTLPTGSGWTFSGPEECDTSDPRVVSLGSAPNIGCDGDCQRTGTCGDGIRQLRFEGCDGGTAYSPELLIKADETSGTIASDSSSNSYNATVSGATWVAGKYGNALKFNGSSNYAIINDNVVVSPSALTVAAWIRKDGNGANYECAVHKGADTSIGASEYFIGAQDGTDNIMATIGARVSGIGWTKGLTSVKANIGVWYHVAAVWDGAVVRVYVNGNLETQYSLTTYSNLTTPTRIGASGNAGGYLFNGAVDDVRIFTEALPQSQIISMMSQSCQPGCMADPLGALQGADRNLINGWACDPDHPMNQNNVRLVFTDANSVVIDTKLFPSSVVSEQSIQDICGGGSNHRWEFDPNDGTINWAPYTQPFTVKAYAVTPDGAPESDTFIGLRTFTMADICGDGVHEGPEECDDGNADNTDNCRTDCKLPSCGDGVVSINATGAYNELCELGQTTSCVSAGVPNGNGTVNCQTDCKSWVTSPNVCTKTWTCPAKPYIYSSTESAWNTVSSYNQVWDGTKWVPADDTTTYDLTGSSTECRFKCGTNFGYDSNRLDWTNPLAWSSSAGMSWDSTEQALKVVSYRNVTLNTYIPIDTSKQYFLEYDIMIKNSAGKVSYSGTRSYNSSYAQLPGHPGSYDYFVDSAASFTAGTWYHRKNSYIGGVARTGESSTVSDRTKWHTGTKFAKVMFLFNYSGTTTQETYIKNLKFYPVGGGNCVGISRKFTCNPKPATGTVWTSPSSYDQTWTWNGTNYDWSPVADSNTNYNTTWANNQCQFKCAADYHWNGSSCVYDFATWNCPAKPANSIWNSVGSYAQSWDGSNYIPASDGTTEYNEIPSTTSCRYKCAPGYFHSGGVCYPAKCGDGMTSEGGIDINAKVILRMNENSGSTAFDTSGNNNNGTLSGMTWTTGQYDYGLNFNGTGYVNLGNNSDLQITGDQTISMWLKPTDFAARRNPYAKAYGGEGTITVETNGTVNYYYGTAGGNTSPYQGFNMSSPLAANTWTHLAIVRDLTNMKLRWYKNGVLTNETNATYASAVASGLSAYVGHGYTSRFVGVIDEFKMYDRALTQAEVASSMQESANTDHSQEVYLTMNEATGSTAYDSSGNANHGTLANTGWVTGKFGTGLNFNGSSSKLDISYTRPTNNFTFMAWVNPDVTHQIDPQSSSSTTGTAGQRYLFGADNYSANSGAGLSVGTNGASVYEHGSGYMPPLAVFDGDLSGWNHVAVTYTNKQPKIYINGELKVTGFTSPKGTVYAPAKVGYGTYGWFDGQVDHVRIFSKPLSQGEIVQAMGEYCDQGASNSDAWHSSPVCNASCTGYGPHCGDSATNGTEACDWGDGAVSTTSWTLNASCDTDCTTNRYCGDGTDDAEEVCDKNASYSKDTLCDRRDGAKDYYSWSTSYCGSSCTIGGTCYYCGDGTATSTSGLRMHLGYQYQLTDNSTNANNAAGGGYSWVTGATGNGVGVSMTSSTMYVPHATTLNLPRNMSVEFWINTSQWVSSTITPVPILVKSSGVGAALNYAVWLEPAKTGLPNGHISFVTYPSSTSGCGAHTTTRIAGAGWKHVVGTYDGSNMRIYVDGNLESTESCYQASTTYNSSPLYIGQYVSYPKFSGSLDEIKLWGRTLSQAEIRRNMKEQCDDGNRSNGDGCDSNCNIERYNKCSGAPSSCYKPTCSHRIVLYDSYGDGWHGNNYVYVKVNGTTVGTYTLSSGYGPATYYFNASPGDSIQVTYSAGSYPGECYYYLYNGSGGTMASAWYPSSSGTYNGTASCP